MLEHPPLAYNVPHAFRPYHLILPDVFQGKGQARVLAFHNPDFTKRALADHPQQAEVVEVDLIGVDNRLAIGVAHLRRRRSGSVMTGKSSTADPGTELIDERERCWLPQRHRLAASGLAWGAAAAGDALWPLREWALEAVCRR